MADPILSFPPLTLFLLLFLIFISVIIFLFFFKYGYIISANPKYSTEF
jgi:hypothetical protein